MHQSLFYVVWKKNQQSTQHNRQNHQKVNLTKKPSHNYTN